MNISEIIRSGFFRVYKSIAVSFSEWYKKIKPSVRWIRLFAASVLILFIFLFFLAPLIENQTPGYFTHYTRSDSMLFSGKKPAENYLKNLKMETDKLDKGLRRLIPARSYLVVNTSENKIYMFSGGKMIHEGICSTGSYTLLKAGADQEWIFRTPKGMFTIKGKTVSPVWRKPDWAFIEEGLPVPPANSHLRFEAGVLGDYALSMGDGYLIHGTLFQRFLGLPVTHGCIRLGDDDLKKVYQTLHIGSRVYIF